MLVVFDLDGTLYQTHKSVSAALGSLCAELGIPTFCDGEILCNIGKTTADFLSSLLPESIDTEAAISRFRELERSSVKEYAELFPGTVDVLAELKKMGHSLAVCSNGSMEYIELVTSITGIKPYFDRLYSSKYSSKAKTLAEIACEASPLVMVGDTGFDIEAAIADNIPSIAAAYGYGKPEDLRRTAFTVNKPDEIPALISQIEIFEKISEAVKSTKARVIGINGVDTSGKSVFSDRFSAYLTGVGIKNAIIHIDDFHNPRAVRLTGNNEIEAYYNNAFNYSQVLNEVLIPLCKVNSLDTVITCLDLSTDKYETEIHYKIDEETVVIVEGVLLFRPPLLSFFDMKIFLDVSFDTVLTRARERDVPLYGEAFLQKYIDKYIPVQKRYIAEHRPKETADFVIDNNDYSRPFLSCHSPSITD